MNNFRLLHFFAIGERVKIWKARLQDEASRRETHCTEWMFFVWLGTAVCSRNFAPLTMKREDQVLPSPLVLIPTGATEWRPWLRYANWKMKMLIWLVTRSSRHFPSSVGKLTTWCKICRVQVELMFVFKKERKEVRRRREWKRKR